PPPPPPPPEPEESEEQRRAREEQERRAAEEAERRRLAQEEARRRAAARSAEQLRIIEAELANLNEGSSPSREEIHCEAIREAEHRSPEDLRDWLRHRVAKANRAGARDPLAAYRKRSISLGQPDADGGRRLSGYLPAADAALIAAVMAAGEKAGANLPPDTLETRTLSQRRVDQLIKVLQNHAALNQTTSRFGVGSVLISLTAEDLEDLSADSQFSTNTGDTLTPVDLLRLGAAQYDVMVLHDTDGQPLTLGRGKRLASFWQRIALAAAEGVCTCGNCTTAGIHLDIHHLRAWEDGGTTDIGNLAGTCRPHHGDNDDTRRRGHLVRCPSTGRVGWRAGPGQPIEFNETHAHQRSNGARIRARKQAAS
ncbi:HNH endonuclease signature motif containing protein, partial [Corynebacterium nasicanis]